MDFDTTSHSGEFSHDRLRSPRSIRLVELLSSNDFQSQLVVQLFEVELDKLSVDDVAYEALSYTWGSPHGTRPILCNTQSFLVTSNCESALRHLRLKDATRVLWVDSICIDQTKSKEGLAERAVQVPLMGEIYAGARHTLCWLGEGFPYTNVVMRFLEQIGDCPSQRGLAKLIRFEESLRDEGMLAEGTSCLDHIFCHSWHSRIWTVQEVAFAIDCLIVCGKSSISWEQYASAASFLIYDQFLEDLDVQAARSVVSIDVRDVLRGYLANQDGTSTTNSEAWDDATAQKITFLTSCLTDVNQLGATDPRDKIYGLYAMYTKLGVPLPAVDYTKSVAQVYTDATVALIAWSASLTVLRDACTTHRDASLPSWVPDWNDFDARMYMAAANASKGSRIRNCLPSILSATPGKLRTKGRVVGEVARLTENLDLMPFPTSSDSIELPILSDVDNSPVSDADFLRLLVVQIKFFRELRHLLQTNLSLCQEKGVLDVLRDTLTLGSGSSNEDLISTLLDILNYPHSQCDQDIGRALAETWKATDKSNLRKWTAELTHCATIAASLLSNSIQVDGEVLPRHGDVLDLMKEIMSNLADQAIIAVRAESVSNLPLIGTTFRTVTVGDKIVLLEGAEWPVVLRPSGRE